MKKYLALCLVTILLSGCMAHGGSSTPTLPADPISLPTAAADTQITVRFPTVPTVPPVETEASFDPYSIIETMTVEELVGQLFLARCPYLNATEDIRRYHLGGFVLFGKDFSNSTPSSVRKRISSFQTASDIPMLIAVDEEGGTVTRISTYRQYSASTFPSPRKLYAQGGLELIIETEVEKCRLLKSLGINVNLAPVCDVTTDPDAFMFHRSVGQSPAVTGAFVAEVCSTMAQEQIGSVLKHFPGYGNNRDTHTGIAVDSRSLELLESCDLIPFRAGIAAGCGGILVSHTIVECLDSTAPASLSAAVISYLRRNLDFDGVVMTDDLIMDAITAAYGTGEAAVLAILAGNDMLCSSEYAEQYAAVLEAVISGRIPLTQVKESVARILHWKHDLGLIAS